MLQLKLSTMAQIEIPTHEMCKAIQDISFRDLPSSKMIAHYDKNTYWPMKLRKSFGNGLYQSFSTLCYMQETQKVARDMNVSDVVSFFVMFLLGRVNRFISEQEERGDETEADFFIFLHQINNMDKEQHFDMYKEMLEGIKFEVSLRSGQHSLNSMTRFHSASDPGADVLTSRQSEVTLVMDEGGQRKIKRRFPFDV